MPYSTIYDLYRAQYDQLRNEIDSCFSDMDKEADKMEAMLSSLTLGHEEADNTYYGKLQGVNEELHGSSHDLSTQLTTSLKRIMSIQDDTLKEKATLLSLLSDIQSCQYQVKRNQLEEHQKMIQTQHIDEIDASMIQTGVYPSNDAQELLHSSLRVLDETTKKFVEMFQEKPAEPQQQQYLPDLGTKDQQEEAELAHVVDVYNNEEKAIETIASE